MVIAVGNNALLYCSVEQCCWRSLLLSTLCCFNTLYVYDGVGNAIPYVH